MYYKKIPSKIRVLEFKLLVWRDRPGGWWKSPLLKKALSFIEFLAN